MSVSWWPLSGCAGPVWPQMASITLPNGQANGRTIFRLDQVVFGKRAQNFLEFGIVQPHDFTYIYITWHSTQLFLQLLRTKNFGWQWVFVFCEEEYKTLSDCLGDQVITHPDCHLSWQFAIKFAHFSVKTLTTCRCWTVLAGKSLQQTSK